jgi:tetratricopeptide (TPR) repeat protein
LDLTSDDAGRAVLLERLGYVQYEHLGPREARRTWEAAMRAYEALDDPVGAARAEVGVIETRTSLESLDPADVIARGKELVALFDRAGDLDGWVQAIQLVGSHLMFLGRNAEGIALMTAGWDRLPMDSPGRGQLANWVTGAYFWGATPVDVAIERIKQIADENPNRLAVQSAAVRTIGALKSMRGDFEGARADIARADAMAAEAGFSMHVASSGSQVLAPVEMRAGNPQAALDAALPSYEAMAATGDLSFSSTSAGMVAWALAELDRLDEAERYAQIALDTSSQSDYESQALGREVLARVLSRQGALAEAERLAREAVAIRDGAENPNGQGEALLVLADVLRLAGRPGAADTLEAAARRFGQKGNVVMVERARSRLAELADTAQGA